MKKILLVFISLFVCATLLHAQEYDEKTFTITPGIEGGIGASSDGYDEATYFGGKIQGEYYASDFYRVAVEAGYLNVKIKDGDNISMMPILLGVKRHFSEPFYVTTGLGVTMIGNGGGAGFTYKFGLGFIIQQKVDLGLQLKSIAKNGSSFILVGLQVGYRL